MRRTHSWVRRFGCGRTELVVPKGLEYTGHFHSDSPWYGSTRIVIRKGELLIGGDQPLAPVEPHVFRPADDPSDADRVTFDTIVDGQALRMNYSGIEFFRMFTP
jgi:hypothetical protein